MRDKLTWLHISDIHFQPKTEWRDGVARDSLITFLEAEFKRDDSLKPDFIFCTGDIAYGETGSSTLKDQYAQIKFFFDELLKVCGKDGAPLLTKRLFFVPGNHDVDRNSINADAQSTLTQWAKDPSNHASEIEQRFHDLSIEFRDAVKRLDEYTQFVQNYLPHQSDQEGRHCYTDLVDVNGIKVGIAGFNSAWTCAGPEDDRTIWLAAQWQFNAAKQQLDSHKAQLRIGLIHHPVDWLNVAERNLATSRISTDFHFWLHGHSHNAWIVPAESHVTIAAGAVGAQSSDEFGVNLVYLDFSSGKGDVHLYQHKAGGSSWTIAPVEVHAPSGVWSISLPADLCKCHVSPSSPSSPAIPAKRATRLYGRETLLKEAAGKLIHEPFLLVCGMRGNGKSALIEELGKISPLAGRASTRITVDPSTTPDQLFRQVAVLLGETPEFPKAPQGDEHQIAAETRSRYPNPRPAWIWVDHAHHLIDAGGFRHPNMLDLFLGLAASIGLQWNWVFELRERPPRGLLGSSASECEVLGLTKTSLGQCLADAAPKGQESDWTYSGIQLKQIYQWLGGGHGEQAHPLAIQFLIEVARGRNETPRDVLLRHREDVTQRVEDKLLDDLYHNVLSDAEQRLIKALALYRNSIPHDHMETLENHLDVNNAWDGLDRRCLLSAAADHSVYYLHSFVASWLRTRQLGFSGHGEDDEFDFAEVITEEVKQYVRELHSAIAQCWLDQLHGSCRLTNLNITRALEAFYHLTAAGSGDRLQEIAVELLTGNIEWARRRAELLYSHLFRSKAPVERLRQALEYAAALDSNDHKVQRFLGECWQKEEGVGSDKALKCFRSACGLRTDFPPYLANLGKALLERGYEGAGEFLAHLESLELNCPAAINDYVRAIQCDCLVVVANSKKASALRMERINAGSRNAVFYVDEAKELLRAGDVAGALAILDRAESIGCADDFTASVRASALQQSDPVKASALRMERINAGSRDAVFYADEAKELLRAGDVVGALAILDKAESIGCANDFIASVRASALQQSDPVKASALRMERINAGSRDAVFYADEAKELLRAGDVVGALAILDKAESIGCADDFIASVRASALQQSDPVKASALRMERINAGSRNAAFYADEAKELLGAGDDAGALAILDKAESIGCADDFTALIRVRIIGDVSPMKS
ncbi:metallophosphoesterase [Desulfobulbus sp.]|uniref:metallophosphoesterase n=1 Tax=Desulfobulbus sp. TaxID=895 RepID=UPI0027BA2507|nr:metallophosphoesterase [Desulfobulbus sp.]